MAQVIADNGQIFFENDVERILSDVNSYDYSTGSKARRYMDQEICDNWNISMAELGRIKYTQSWEANKD